MVLRYEPGALEVLVSDNGNGARSGTDGGHGLIGLRERVSLYGGRLWAGSEGEAGFRLRARLPLGDG